MDSQLLTTSHPLSPNAIVLLKVKMRPHYSAVLLMASPVVTAPAPLNETLAKRDFKDSCRICYLESYWEPGTGTIVLPIYNCQCRKFDGSYVTSRLDLRGCIGNFGGWLTWAAK
jgi:hypothetical protein